MNGFIRLDVDIFRRALSEWLKRPIMMDPALGGAPGVQVVDSHKNMPDFYLFVDRIGVALVE